MSNELTTIYMRYLNSKHLIQRGLFLIPEDSVENHSSDLFSVALHKIRRQKYSKILRTLSEHRFEVSTKHMIVIIRNLHNALLLWAFLI